MGGVLFVSKYRSDLSKQQHSCIQGQFNCSKAECLFVRRFSFVWALSFLIEVNLICKIEGTFISCYFDTN